MTDIKIKRYADKENLKELMKYSKDTFANKSEINENYYTKEQIDIMLKSAGSDKYGESIMATEAEGGDDATGGLSFYNVVERAPGSDGTSQITIAEDADTVEDE